MRQKLSNENKESVIKRLLAGESTRDPLLESEEDQNELKIFYENKESAIKRLLDGESPRALSKELGIAISTLARWKQLAKTNKESREPLLESDVVPTSIKYKKIPATDWRDERIADLETENTRLKCYIADVIVLHKFVCESEHAD